MPKDTAVLERELQDTKEHASELAGQNERNKKEIGNLRKAVAAGEELDQENAALKVAAVKNAAKIKALEAALAGAGREAAKGEKAVAAGKAISDALGQLSAL